MNRRNGDSVYIHAEAREAGKHLVWWLNAARTEKTEVLEVLQYSAPSRSRLLALINEVITLQGVQITVADRGRAHLAMQFLWLDKAMEKYQTSPTLVFFPKGSRWAVVRKASGNGAFPPSEVLLAQTILDLAKLGLLDRVRLCDCGLWFFARRHDGVAHDTKCRQKLWEKSRVTKERRKKKREENKPYATGLIHMRSKNAKASK